MVVECAHFNAMTEQKGILSQVSLPSAHFDELWQRIIVPEDIKNRLIAQILLEFTVRRKIPHGALPIHGLILMVGPPGTGKTSIAKGAASTAATYLKGSKVKFIQVEPHGLTSSSLGRSQKDMHQFLTGTIAEHASQGPLIVLLDEIETLAVDRRKLSLEANPIDVHRATDAVLAALDHLAEQYPDLLFIGTSNFAEAVDEAIMSRADLVIHIEKPSDSACEAILRDTLDVMGQQWPLLKKLSLRDDFKRAVAACKGLDGRQIRKAVLQACGTDLQVAKDPNGLTVDQLIGSLKNSKKEHS